VRHYAAMDMLHSGVAFSVSRPDRGNESTTTKHRYVEVHLTTKQTALTGLQEAARASTRYRPPDALSSGPVIM